MVLTLIKNYHELLLVFNLQSLFAISLYTTSNSIAVNTFIGIVIVQFVVFILYNRKQCRKAAHACLTTVFVKLNLLKYYFGFVQDNAPITRQDFKLLNQVPEIAYNYREFQEPMIGQDE